MFLFPFSVFLLLFVALLSTIYLRGLRRNLPPGPVPLPIIGNLHMLGKLPHRSLQNMAKKYGPIMMVRLGSMATVVVSSPRAAELFLKTHDTNFASRPRSVFSEKMSYGSKGLVFSEYGPYWRNVRKFCTLELLSAAKTASFAGMRREELEVVVGEIREAAEAREVVDVSKKVMELMENTTYRMVFGRSRDDRFDLKGIIVEVMAMAGAFNLVEYLPFLGPLDPQGFKHRLNKTYKVMDEMLDVFLDEHMQNITGDNRNNDVDFLDVLLTLMNNSNNLYDELSQSFNKSNIKAIVLDILAASIDTSATTIEWVLSELIKNPRVMRLLQEELESVIELNGIIDENNLENFTYLDMVIKESLRLHPVGPLLVPRECINDIVVDGYFIPKKSRILVNTWAIGRDTKVWSDNAEEFKPERFINTDIEMRGRHFELLPFGSGRRGCPGTHLGLINTKLVVAQLVHCFKWTLPNGMLPNELDMTEKFGLTAPRDVHLFLVPTPR